MACLLAPPLPKSWRTESKTVVMKLIKILIITPLKSREVHSCQWAMQLFMTAEFFSCPPPPAIMVWLCGSLTWSSTCRNRSTPHVLRYSPRRRSSTSPLTSRWKTKSIAKESTLMTSESPVGWLNDIMCCMNPCWGLTALRWVHLTFLGCVLIPLTTDQMDVSSLIKLLLTESC